MARATHFFDQSDSNRYKKKYHLSMEFLDKALTLGLFQVFQVCDLSCSSDYQCPPHQQICLEISYIVSGHGIYERNNVPYEVTPNTVFLVNDHDLHAVRSSKDDPCATCVSVFPFVRNILILKNIFHSTIFLNILKIPSQKITSSYLTVLPLL